MKLDNINTILETGQKLGHTIEILGNVKSGKEASVYRVLLDGELVAMKLYKDAQERTFKNTTTYLTGKFYKKASHEKAITKGNTFGKKLIYDNWVYREFSLLEKLYSLGTKIPKPILHIENAIFMEYLGEGTTPAPRLCDAEFTQEEAHKMFDAIIQTILIFWEAGIVHADLSEYNILWWKNEVYIIDFPQSTDRKTNPNSQIFLERDLKNLIRFFERYIEIDHEKIFKIFNDGTQSYTI